MRSSRISQFSRMGARSVRRTRLALVLLLVAGGALAAVPSPEKIARAVAEANELAGRAGPLVLGVSLQVAGSGHAAEGEIATHPTGLARLELRNSAGFVERHLLLGAEYSASRDGALLDRPHPFLPPVFLLQATTAATLSAALISFGVHSEEVVLGRMGDRDCYVFGGRNPGSAFEVERLLPSLWIDMTSYEPLRLARADGTEYRLGPSQIYEGIRLPQWIDIDGPDSLRARLTILSAARASVPAAVFQTEWLTSPATPELLPEMPAPAGAAPARLP